MSRLCNYYRIIEVIDLTLQLKHRIVGRMFINSDQRDRDINLKLALYSRRHSDWLQVGRRWRLTGGALGVHVTVQLGADIVVS